MSILRKVIRPKLNKSCSKFKNSRDTFGPMLRICLKNLENKTQCVLSHKLIEKDNGSTNIFPAICPGCLAHKFGLIEKSFEDHMFGCSINNNNKTFVEGPYLCAVRKPKCEVVYPKDTVILPCGYWVFHILSTDRLNLFRDADKIPKVRFRDKEYIMNKFVFDYFRSIHRKFLENEIFVGKEIPNLLGLFELDSLLMCSIVQPSASQSRIKQSSYKGNVLDTKDYLVDTDTESLKRIPKNTEPFVKDYLAFLTNYLEYRLETLEPIFQNITNVTGKQIASFCIPGVITDENDVIYRQMDFNVTWKEKIGLVAVRDIYPEEMLIIDASIKFSEFKNLKITQKKIN